MNNKGNENMTNSQAKRAARKAAAEKAKKAAIRDKVIGYISLLIIGLVFVAIIALGVSRSVKRVTPSDNYIACLDENGFIKNTGASDIDLPDYKNITVPLTDVEFTDEEVDDAIESLLSSYKYLDTQEGLIVADGDEVNIDYVGTVDGVEFDGGAAEGYDLTIGSGAFIPGFEEQLIGAEVLSTFDINVTFPEDYNDELGGKEAVFNITVNGINKTPEFTDDFVAENLSEKATTVEEYKQFLKDSNYNNRLRTWIEDYIDDNSVVNRFDKKYVKNLKSTIKNDDMRDYEYSAQMYEQILGYSYYNSFEDYVGMSEAEYDGTLEEKAKDTYKNNLAFQSILELEGASVEGAYLKNLLVQEGNPESTYDSLVEEYGLPFVNQMAIREKAIDVVKDMVTVQ